MLGFVVIVDIIRKNDIQSPFVFVLITDNKFDFYNITEIFDKNIRF